MAYRLATEYTQSRLMLSEQDLRKACGIFIAYHISVNRICNGEEGCILRLEKEQETAELRFEKIDGHYLFEGTILLNQRDLVNAMREVVAVFKGHCIVNRIYSQFTISYHYEHGMVTKIIETGETTRSMIFEKKHQHGDTIVANRITATEERLCKLFEKQDVEQRIVSVRKEIDSWLDIRNRIKHSQTHVQLVAVDQRLSDLTKALQSMEA